MSRTGTEAHRRSYARKEKKQMRHVPGNDDTTSTEFPGSLNKALLFTGMRPACELQYSENRNTTSVKD